MKQTMKTFIANPFYDCIFSHMMEDECVAKLFISALLQKEVLSVKIRQHKREGKHKACIPLLFRIDLLVAVKGMDDPIIVRFRKTWRVTKTVCLRQYLGAQYVNEDVLEREENRFGLPVVDVYILCHKLGELTNPVVYVQRHILDYSTNLISDGVSDKFIENLPYDSIIVQSPYLREHAYSRLERILSVFNQEYCMKGNEHVLELEEDLFCPDEQLLLNRLLRVAADPDFCHAMDMEDELLSEIEERDTKIMLLDKMIEERKQMLKINQTFDSAICLLYTNNMSVADIAAQLSIREEEVTDALKRKGLK